MKIRWTHSALADVERLFEFLLPNDPARAGEVLDRLVAAPESLLDFPRRGSPCPGFGERNVREFRVDVYLLRYELVGETIHVLRIFHAREDRY